MLQARPITAYLPLPDEMVTAPGAPKHLYANSTLIEQGVQEPLSVLGTDFLGYVLKQVGGSIGTEAVGPGGMTFTAGGGYYMDISYALKLGMGKAALAPGSFGDPRVMAILDGIDMQQYLSVELPPKLKSLRGKMLFTMLPMAGVRSKRISGRLTSCAATSRRCRRRIGGSKRSRAQVSRSRSRPSSCPSCCDFSTATTASR